MSKIFLLGAGKSYDSNEQVKIIGRERFKAILPKDAQAVIIAEEQQDDSEPMTDYYGCHTTRTVILGFSTHKRDLFSEMRKYARNFEGTAYLAEQNAEYENREKYSMGAGYYLGARKYSGWIIRKEPFYGSQEQIIERYALIAGDEENICLKVQTQANATPETVTGDFIIVDYSEKAIAVFGDTRPIKDQLKALGGRFNPRLTHEGEKQAGWIFSKELDIRNLLTIK
jgi:ribonuclease BN (tRNA processing enzyme)